MKHIRLEVFDDEAKEVIGHTSFDLLIRDQIYAFLTLYFILRGIFNPNLKIGVDTVNCILIIPIAPKAVFIWEEILHDGD